MIKTTLILTLLASAPALAEPVNVENFVRAESDHMLRQNMAAFNIGVGEFAHVRIPTSPDNQPVIRMNQDTLYSGAVVDLSKPAVITLPEAEGRYMSMHVVNQDHYMYVESGPGTYELTLEKVGTQFALVTIRILVNSRDPEDVAAVHTIQDAISLDGGGDGPFTAPDWDLEALGKARKSLNDLAVLGFHTDNAFGRKEDTLPVDHLVGAAAGWGGLPKSAAMYVLDAVSANDGETLHAVTTRDVPVNAFWSVTVYNADGYLEANDLGVNSYNNLTADTNPDGSQTIHFGGCEDGRINCIPITPGWNYAIRLYEPGEEILDGSWTFPEITPTE